MGGAVLAAVSLGAAGESPLVEAVKDGNTDAVRAIVSNAPPTSMRRSPTARPRSTGPPTSTTSRRPTR